MTLELKIALRFLKSGKAQTILIVLGIALGVAVQIFLGSLITSLQVSLIDNTIGNSPHITIRSQEDPVTLLLEQNSPSNSVLRGNFSVIEKPLDNWSLIIEKIQKDSRITAISPTLQGVAVIRSGKPVSVQIKGIQIEQADLIYNIQNRIFEGNDTLEGNNIFIGRKLSENLEVQSGEFISIQTADGDLVKLFVNGIFDLENESVNETLVFMDLKRAQKLFNKGYGISSIEIQVGDPFESEVIASEWRDKLDNVQVDQWQEQNKQLLSALSSQSSSSYTIQFFVVLAVTLGISSVLAVSVVQKSKEIGILKAMGATKRSASLIFVLQGLILGFIGSLIGVILGMLLLGIFNYFNQESASFTVTYQLSSIFLILCIAMGSGALASLIPALRSANLNPMEAIKNG